MKKFLIQLFVALIPFKKARKDARNMLFDFAGIKDKIWFEDYFSEEEIETKLFKLQSNLDEKSIELINLYISRQDKYYIPFNDFEKNEKKLIDESVFPQYKSAKGFIKEVLYYKNGLSFIPGDVEDRLKDKCIIDGGACCGDSALVFSEFDVEKIYSFEIMDNLVKVLEENINLNNVSEKVEIVQLGLSGKSNETISIMGKDVKTTTIDEFSQNIKIGAIKLDIEGVEFSVISGALEAIKRDKPILLICIYHNAKDLFEIKPMLEDLNIGYKFMVRDSEPCNKFVKSHLMLIAY